MVCAVLRLGVLVTAAAAIPTLVWRRVGGKPLSYIVLLSGIAALAGCDVLRLVGATGANGSVWAALAEGRFPLETAGFGLVLGGFLALMDNVRRAKVRQRREATDANARAEEARLHKAKLEAILNGAADYCIFTCDPAGRITSYSSGGARVLGWQPDEVVARKSIEVFRPPAHRLTVSDVLNTARIEGRFEAEVPMVRKDGQRIAALLTVTPLAGPDGGMDGYVAVAKDVSEMRAAREALRRERDFVRGIIETSGLFIIGVSPADGRITLFNHGAERISGFRRDEVLGRTYAEVFLDESGHGRVENLLEEFRTGAREPVGQYESTLLSKDGRPRSLFWTYSASVDEDGQVTFIVGFGQDVTERRQMQESLQATQRELEEANRALSRLATTDYLTGLVNRRQADLLLEREVARARRHCTPVSVVMMDLDHFKAINDTRGHEVGDLCLKHVAEILRGRLRGTDIVARYGGEEFLLVLPGAEPEQAAVLADQVRRRIQDTPVQHDGDSIPLTISAGVAVFELHRNTLPDTLVRWADEAMYCAKNLGGNRVVVWDDMQEGNVEPSLTATHQAQELRRSIESLGRQNRQVFLRNLYQMIDTIESRNPYTEGHSRNVAHYATAMARELGLGDDDVALIARAAMLQDLGKSAIPQSAIWKDEPLSKGDWALVCQHPAATVKILGRIGFLHREVHLIRHHHERPDGRGYPDGLAGEAIPLGSRIMAVAEALDAMTRDRPHRPALPLAEVLEQLQAGAFKQFDRQVVEAAVTAARTDDWPLTCSPATAGAGTGAGADAP